MCRARIWGDCTTCRDQVEFSMQIPAPIRDWMTLPPGFDPQRPKALGAKLRDVAGFKRWFYLLLSSERQQIGVAWVDLGYMAKVFAHVSLPEDGLTSFSAEAMCPGPASRLRRNADGWLLQAGGKALRLNLRQTGHLGLLNLSAPGFGLSASWEQSHQSLLLAETGMPHHTHKAFGIPARWQLRLPDQLLTEQGVLGADVSYGYPPRHTRWYWAFANSPELGFNLVEGFVGAAECALWQSGELLPLAEGRFERGENWQIQSADGVLDLVFTPRSEYLDRTRLGLVSSDFVQAYGRYRGELRLDGRVQQLDLPGVAEYQDTKW
ncbi:MAG: hypothetical protein CVV27_00240 [Candidatus Melainabacteria bacterium HGW-Melainabacteria-1]|nr:MAG: hypothetical protein CVV27_00240 [Candidatus Melainabacteria bacterium HGW-Melainabacteria-1]